MTCTHDDRLLDLVMGELPEAEAAALRAEAEACPHCQHALADLELGAALAARMPMEEPPASLDAAIMAAAEKKAAELTGARDSAPAGVAPVAPDPIGDASVAEPAAGPSIWERLTEWAKGITLGPQLAMASVMLLVVSIGLWYLPGVGEPDQVARTQVSPDPEGEAISALPGTGDRSMDPGFAPSPEEAEGEEAGVALNVAQGEKDQDDSEAPGRPRAFEPPADRVGASSGFRNRGDLAERRSRGSGGSLDAPAQQAPSPAPPSPERQAQARAEARRAPLTDSDGEMPSYAPNAAVGGSNAPSAPSTAGAAEAEGSSYEQGVAQYRGGRYQAAEDELRDAVESENQREVLPNSIHQLARSYRQRNECREAVTHYQDLFQRFPSYAQTPQALLEAADCQRRLGRLRQARSLLERAQRFASTRTAATRELRRVETLERASRRARRPAAADSYEAAEAY